MTKNLIKVVALVLVLCMLTAVFASCKSKKKPAATTAGTTTAATTTTGGNDVVVPPYDGGDTLVVGYSPFSGKFSPFFATTAYDQDVAGMTQVGLLSTDREGNVVKNGIEGETIAYNGTDYTYTGIANVEITVNDDGTVKYAFTLRDDVKFSDGETLTVDDVIFTMYVLSDPTYNGSSTFYALPIKGMEEYRQGMEQLGNLILAMGPTYTANDNFTEAEHAEYWAALKVAGTDFVKEIVDYVNASYASYYTTSYGGKWGEAIAENEGLKVAFGMAMWGFGGWTSETTYAEDATGNVGLVGEEYKNLWTFTDSEEDASFAAVVGGETKLFTRATAETTANLYYISATEQTEAGYVYTVTAFEGTRYTGTTVYDGAFEDSLGNVYDCTTTYPTLENYWAAVEGKYVAGEDYVAEYSNLTTTETAGTSLFDFLNANTNDKFTKGIQTGEGAANISGIVKTGANTFEVNMTEFDAVAIYQLGVSVAPLHYYGSDDLYDYDNNKFGFVKGDLSSVRAKTSNPVGAGAYKFVKFESGVVTFERNELYWKGCPKIQYVKFQEVTSEADKVSGITTGTIDVSDPSSTESAINTIKGANSNGELSGNVVTYNAVDNLGYGYIGICANTVKVGTDAASDASKNLRKGFATLFSVYREVVINSYYGDRAAVINYPISNTSWAAPKPADEGYAIAYSKDVNGNPIYTDSMSTDERYAAALAAAVGFFKAAGYTYDEATKKFTAAPEGASLAYEFIIPADGIGDHPSYDILTNAKEALETVGITLNINDPSDSNVLWDALEAGTCNMWAAAWGSTVDPDMYQVYHSSNVVGLEGSTESNHYFIQDAELDNLIMEARKSADNTYRKTLYKQCLEIILDWGVEVPTYQRQNMLIFSTERVNVSTLTPDITTYWGWMNDIELLEMNKVN